MGPSLVHAAAGCRVYVMWEAECRFSNDDVEMLSYLIQKTQFNNCPPVQTATTMPIPALRNPNPISIYLIWVENYQETLRLTKNVQVTVLMNLREILFGSKNALESTDKTNKDREYRMTYYSRTKN